MIYENIEACLKTSKLLEIGIKGKKYKNCLSEFIKLLANDINKNMTKNPNLTLSEKFKNILNFISIKFCNEEGKLLNYKSKNEIKIIKKDLMIEINEEMLDDLVKFYNNNKNYSEKFKNVRGARFRLISLLELNEKIIEILNQENKFNIYLKIGKIFILSIFNTIR
jgi:hypothetical protein